MDKVYDHTLVEEKTYQMWEKGNYFKPEINKKAFDSDNKNDKFTIILPPPNANGALHFGHAMFTVEDILIRYNRMKGKATLWLPGTDHAGIETQFVFEKKLQKEGKSRFDFSREELYAMIRSYVDENRGGIENQLKRLGFSLDWSREKYTLDPQIVDLVIGTFRKMYKEGLVYRDYRLVNYCTKDATSLSDLEVKYVEQQDPMYYLKYGPFILGTVRPETKFGDTAVAVNPSDDRYKKWVGKEIEVEGLLGKFTIRVIADEAIDPEFGTGVMKVTPAHDFNDYEIGKRHTLALKQIIGFDGKLTEATGPYAGMRVKAAREKVVADMQAKGLIDHIDANYTHSIATCYKCGTVLEPLPLEQWYVKVDTLKERAIQAVKNQEVLLYPKNFENPYFQWLENLHDWNISRQNVWGIRIPVWYEVEHEEDFTVAFLNKEGKYQQGELSELLKSGVPFEEITQKLQKVIAKITTKVVFEDQKEKGKRYLPETDTFDTWFSSGQWPYVTLKTSRPGDFEKFYPTSVMETAYDILKAWVSRMVMFGFYLSDQPPFKTVLFHGIVNDPYGKKMSKSKGNVVNPLELVEQYGADAVRFALVYGNGTGADQSLSYSKLDAARKFTNKLWNMARFIEMKRVQEVEFKVQRLDELIKIVKNGKDREWIEKTQKIVAEVSKYIDNYQFNLAAERLYEFIWHAFADVYIEDVKQRIDENSSLVLASLFSTLLTLLHPFMPFVTEEIYQILFKPGKPLIIASWPQ